VTTIEHEGKRVEVTGRAAALARWLMDNHEQLERPSKTGIEAHFGGAVMVVKLHQVDELSVYPIRKTA
jgi:hypothetical protein